MPQGTVDNLNIQKCNGLNHYDVIDRTKYGTYGILPKKLYDAKPTIYKLKPEIEKKHACMIDQQDFQSLKGSKNDISQCLTDTTHKRLGYHDIPCLKSAYRNKEYYNVDRAMIYFNNQYGLK